MVMRDQGINFLRFCFSIKNLCNLFIFGAEKTLRSTI